MDTTTAEAMVATERANDLAQLEALARSARAGEPGSFDLLARLIGGRLMAFARRVIGDRALAEEAVQEALVRMYRALPRYTDGNVLSWAFTICHRTCADVVKRERRRSHLRLIDGDHAVADPTAAVDVREAVERALAGLPEPLRTAFLLRQQGLTYTDIATIVDVPVGTVRSRLFEARKRLRAALAPSFHPGRNSDEV